MEGEGRLCRGGEGAFRGSDLQGLEGLVLGGVLVGCGIQGVVPCRVLTQMGSKVRTCTTMTREITDSSAANTFKCFYCALICIYSP